LRLFHWRRLGCEHCLMWSSTFRLSLRLKICLFHSHSFLLNRGPISRFTVVSISLVCWK
jgi:hypothetical protein